VRPKTPISKLLLLPPPSRAKKANSTKYGRKRVVGVGGGEEGQKTPFEPGKYGKTFSSCSRRKSFVFGVFGSNSPFSDDFFKLLLLEQEEKVLVILGASGVLVLLFGAVQQHVLHDLFEWLTVAKPQLIPIFADSADCTVNNATIIIAVDHFRCSAQ